jgi:hypothetical protein
MDAAHLLSEAGLLAGRLGARFHLRDGAAEEVARVTVESVSLTPGDAMLLVRYRVRVPGRLELGPDRFSVIEEASGRRLGMRLAEAGTTAIHEAARDQTGYVLVTNCDGAVAPGAAVTVFLGGDTRRHLTVTRVEART